MELEIGRRRIEAAGMEGGGMRNSITPGRFIAAAAGGATNLTGNNKPNQSWAECERRKASSGNDTVCVEAVAILRKCARDRKQCRL